MPANLHFKRLGCAQPNQADIVLLHGFMGQGDDWEALLTPYLLHHSFVLIDLPCHGLSESLASNSCAFTQFEQRFKQTLTAANVKRYKLYGYSLGGRLALCHASHQPEGLQQLMLESCHPGLSSSLFKNRRKQWLQRWQHKLLSQPLSRVLRQWYQQPVFASLTPRQATQQIKLRLKSARAADWAQALTGWSVHRQPDLTQLMINPRVPTQFLVGARDPNYAKIARSMIQARSSAEINISRTAGHNVHATAQQDWHHYFSQWLQD